MYSEQFFTKCDIYWTISCSFHPRELMHIFRRVSVCVKRLLIKKLIFQKWWFRKNKNSQVLSSSQKHFLALFPNFFSSPHLEMLADKFFGGGGESFWDSWDNLSNICQRNFFCREDSYEILKLLQRVESLSDIRELENIF